jgi:hypothetical protein
VAGAAVGALFTGLVTAGVVVAAGVVTGAPPGAAPLSGAVGPRLTAEKRACSNA